MNKKIKSISRFLKTTNVIKIILNLILLIVVSYFVIKQDINQYYWKWENFIEIFFKHLLVLMILIFLILLLIKQSVFRAKIDDDIIPFYITQTYIKILRKRVINIYLSIWIVLITTLSIITAFWLKSQHWIFKWDQLLSLNVNWIEIINNNKITFWIVIISFISVLITWTIFIVFSTIFQYKLLKSIEILANERIVEWRKLANTKAVHKWCIIISLLLLSLFILLLFMPLILTKKLKK